tara:strand:+ start:414 stop:593 length:180 start_codon:yes stop_codon:yes gene_type:complete
MIIKYQIIRCDNCESEEGFPGKKDAVKDIAASVGWILQGDLHFCCTPCRSLYYSKRVST